MPHKRKQPAVEERSRKQKIGRVAAVTCDLIVAATGSPSEATLAVIKVGDKQKAEAIQFLQDVACPGDLSECSGEA